MDAIAFDRRRVAIFHGGGTNDNGKWQLEDTTWRWNGTEWRVDLPR